jgi:hypothetical protein
MAWINHLAQQYLAIHRCRRLRFGQPAKHRLALIVVHRVIGGAQQAEQTRWIARCQELE